MKKHVRCVLCSSLNTQRWGQFKRPDKDPLQRFKCLGCQKTFTTGFDESCSIDRKERVSITRTHLEGRTSIRTLARQTGHSKTSICDAIHKVTRECVSAVRNQY